MTELKPCPFCGGTNLKIKGGIGKYVRCLDCDNGAHFPERGSTANEGDAIKAWNTRAERTCHLERIPYEPGEYEGMRCSVCKTVDLEMGVGPYCPGCGAKVVE